LFQVAKDIRIKKVRQRDFQTITQLFNRYNSGV